MRSVQKLNQLLVNLHKKQRTEIMQQKSLSFTLMLDIKDPKAASYDEGGETNSFETKNIVKLLYDVMTKICAAFLQAFFTI
jgi:hypothetical protein